MDCKKHLNGVSRGVVLWSYILVSLLSAVQIYFRRTNMELDVSVIRLVWTNLLAWLPWPLLAPTIFGLWRKMPPYRPKLWKWLGYHLLMATLFAFVFLVYLTVFRFILFPQVTGSFSWATFPIQLGLESGEFFLVAWGLYWGIGVAGHKKVGVATSQSILGGREAIGDRLEIKSLGRVRWVMVKDLVWIEADGSYVRLHTATESHIHRMTMSQLAKSLAASGFCRVHRSAIVNVDHICELYPQSHGDAEIRLSSGKTLRVSRTYRRMLEEWVAARKLAAEGRKETSG